MGLLEDKVAVVTAGANGIGRASSLSFAREGAKVMVSDINEEAGRAVVEEIRSGGGTAEFMLCDASSEDDVEALIKGTLDTFGRLDCAHNNAGDAWGDPGFANCSVEDWHKTIDLTLMGVWLGMRAEMPVMAEQGGGAIVNTSSMVALRVRDTATAAYSAAKAGVISLTEFGAIEYADKGVRVNAVAPGLARTVIVEDLFTPEQQQALATKNHPIARLVEPQEVADAVIYLCSDKASMVTGITLPISGGASVV